MFEVNEIRVSDAAYRRARQRIAREFVQVAVRNRGAAYTQGQLSGLHLAFMAIPGATEDEWVELCSETAFAPAMRRQTAMEATA
jgi:hypothetical protein